MDNGNKFHHAFNDMYSDHAMYIIYDIYDIALHIIAIIGIATKPIATYVIVIPKMWMNVYLGQTK